MYSDVSHTFGFYASKTRYFVANLARECSYFTFVMYRENNAYTMCRVRAHGAYSCDAIGTITKYCNCRLAAPIWIDAHCLTTRQVMSVSGEILFRGFKLVLINASDAKYLLELFGC